MHEPQSVVRLVHFKLWEIEGSHFHPATSEGTSFIPSPPPSPTQQQVFLRSSPTTTVIHPYFCVDKGSEHGPPCLSLHWTGLDPLVTRSRWQRSRSEGAGQGAGRTVTNSAASNGHRFYLLVSGKQAEGSDVGR